MQDKVSVAKSTGPVVSVIIPAFNEEKNITRLLQSIKNQTYKYVEIIVVDDGSKDRTVELARKHRVKVYVREHAERSIQRNFGASKAWGKYLFFVDADMELTRGVVKSCVESIDGHAALIVPERTVGSGFMAKIRAFEREMYMGDPTIEVARFFDSGIFRKFGGYDPSLTGTEDYDLPKRISSRYTIGWSKSYILHHEAQRTLANQLKRKFYYASRSAIYARKHPDLIATQGNLLFRKAYLRNWRKFIGSPLIGISFLGVRVLETMAAVAGYIKVVGLREFVKTFFLMFK